MQRRRHGTMGGVLLTIGSLGGGCLSDHCEVYPEHCVGLDDADAAESETSADLPPEAPVLLLGFSQIKQFDFSWAPATRAEYYRLLESVDGEPHGQVGEDIVGLETSLTVPLHFRPNASYVLQACNAGGCTDSDVVDVVGSLAEAVGYFKASNTGATDYFGYDVALSADGRMLAVGAYVEDSNAFGIDGNQADNSDNNAGAVYVFTRTADTWAQEAYVKASNTDAGDYFGNCVALSSDGSTLAVGAVGEDGSGLGVGGNPVSNSASGAGAVYVFARSDGTWAQEAYIKASNTDQGDTFGESVALSDDGSTLAVGATREDSGLAGNPADDSTDDAGAVYLFTRTAGAWAQQAYVKASNLEVDDSFGNSVALSGDGSTLAVGAYGEDSSGTTQADNSTSNAGAVYVFTRTADTWMQQAYVKASNAGANDYFGYSVALSGDGGALAVGAYGESSANSSNQADDSAPFAGAVYVFLLNSDVWAQDAYVKIFNSDANNVFGYDVALSDDGSTLAVGAHNEDSSALGIGGIQADDSASDAGAVYVFTRTADAWAQQAYVKASSTDANDHFGKSVALSGDGSTLAVGAYGESSSAEGIGGDQADNTLIDAGAVYLY